MHTYTKPFQDGLTPMDAILYPRNETAIAWAARVEARRAAERVRVKRALRVTLRTLGIDALVR